MGMGQFFPSGYGYGSVCPVGTIPTAIPSGGDGWREERREKRIKSEIPCWITE
jgi:hypothetical protein